jgi:hypothetical protein
MVRLLTLSFLDPVKQFLEQRHFTPRERKTAEAFGDRLAGQGLRLVALRSVRAGGKMTVLRRWN